MPSSTKDKLTNEHAVNGTWGQLFLSSEAIMEHESTGHAQIRDSQASGARKLNWELRDSKFCRSASGYDSPVSSNHPRTREENQWITFEQKRSRCR